MHRTRIYYLWQFLKFALQVICGILVVETYCSTYLQYISFWPIRAGHAIEKNRKISAKNANVAIKRAKSNALALAISSDSNFDKVNYAKACIKKMNTWFERKISRICLMFATANKKNYNQRKIIFIDRLVEKNKKQEDKRMLLASNTLTFNTLIIFSFIC